LARAGVVVIWGAWSSSASCTAHEEFTHLGVTNENSTELRLVCTLTGVEEFLVAGSESLAGTDATANVVPCATGAVPAECKKANSSGIQNLAWIKNA